MQRDTHERKPHIQMKDLVFTPTTLKASSIRSVRGGGQIQNHVCKGRYQFYAPAASGEEMVKTWSISR